MTSPWTGACGTAALLLLLGCGNEVSYARDVHPIVQERCVMCHFDGRAERSLEHPFDPHVLGMFTQQSRWWLGGHGGRQYNVVPGEPDRSFLLQKITDPELLPEACDAQDCAIERAGLFMPPRPPPMTDAQIGAVSQWIQEGATDTSFFRGAVVPIFGEKDNFRGDYCGRGGYAPGCILCGRCHFDGAPTYPVLELPRLDTLTANTQVAAWLHRLVGARAMYRPDLQLVVPGDPEASFLVAKMKATSSSTALGASMPYGFEPLTDAQVTTVREWIAQGARDN